MPVHPLRSVVMYARSRLVPISEGSSGAVSLDVASFRLTHATFPAGSVIRPHVHDRTCVAIMLGGSFDLRFAGRSPLDCAPGTLFVEPVGDTHCNCVGCAGADVLVIQPDPAAQESLAPLLPFLDGVRHAHSPALASFARRMANELGCVDALSPLVLEGLALELLTAAARLHQAVAGPQPPRWVNRAEELLRERFREGVQLSDVAAECGVDASRLAREFRRRHHCSVGEFVRHLRIEWAAARLGDEGATIAGVACEAGFADQSHFTHRFRAQLGMTPGQWRRNRGRAES